MYDYIIFERIWYLSDKHKANPKSHSKGCKGKDMGFFFEEFTIYSA